MDINQRLKLQLFVVFTLAIALAFVITATSDETTDASTHSIQYIDPSSVVGNVDPLIPYSGIASTEYNPQFWNNTGNVGNVENWTAPPSSWNYELTADGNINTIEQGQNPTKSYTVTYVNNETHIVSSASDAYSITIQNWPVSLEFKSTTNNKTYYFKIPHTAITNKSTNMTLDSTGSTYDTYKFTGNDSNVTVSFTITNYTLSPDKVFGGWLMYEESSGKWITVYPGDIVGNNVSKLYAKWIEPDVFIMKNDSVFVDHWDTDYKYVFEIVSPYAKPTNIYESYDIAAIDMDKYKGRYETVIRGDSRPANTPDMFGTIFLLSKENTKDWKNYFTMEIGARESPYLNALPTGTYRSADTNNPVLLRIGGKVADGNLCELSGNVIIDNVGMKKTANDGQHGDSGTGAIFANGHVLIIGVNIQNPTLGSGQGKSTNPANEVPQIFGGSYHNLLSEPVVFNGYDPALKKNYTITEKDIVFGDGRTTSGLSVKLGTCVIIHDGIYLNIVAGSWGRSLTDANHPMSTYLVLKGGTTTDTVVGGCSGNAGCKIYGGELKDNTHPENVGGTFVYLTGHYAAGDNWEDAQTGFSDSSREYSIVQSTVVEGGMSRGSSLSNQSKIFGSTHIFLTGNASVWDIQAGGRSGYTHTDTAYLEISGDAIVRHLACGTITDGISSESNSNNCVDNVIIKIGQNAKVASVFGGGYDNYEIPNGRSMLWDSSISITIDGGTVGYVFGGGYRGTIGKEVTTQAAAQGHKNLVINIEIKGGNIVHDVYGGGSGGLDKIKHNPNGTINTDITKVQGLKNSVGFSNVYGDVNITISGSTVIGGNVYGGGMSLPILEKFLTNDKSITDFKSGDNDVACVYGDVSVTVNGGTINGNVYGGGKGINASFEGGETKFYDDETHDEGSTLAPTFVVLKKDEFGIISVSELAWFTGTDGEYTYKYAETKDDDVMITAKHSEIYYEPVEISNVIWFKNTDSQQYKDIQVIITDSHNTVYNQGIDSSGFFIENNNVKYYPAADGSFVTKTVPTQKINVTISSGVSFYWAEIYGESPNESFRIEKVGATTGIYLERYAKVTGNTTVKINDGTVNKNVYGAGSIGKLNGSTIVDVSGGTIGLNVFGGGLGVVGNEGMTGSRGVYVSGKDTVIHGSVYGGSSNGDDGTYDNFWSGNPKLLSNSTVVIDQGTIEGDVFGGGFMGNTWGNTAIYIGHHYSAEQKYSHDKDGSNDRESKKISLKSIYAGGNIRISDDDSSQAFTEVMVWGTGHIEVCGNEGYRTILITGSIMGSGNSCNTYGKTDILLERFEGIEKLNAIHRATNLTLNQSSVKISGRTTTTDKVASIYKIEYFTLQFNSSVTIDKEIYEVEEFSSLNRDGNPTTAGSPSNMVVFTEGSTFTIGTSSTSTESHSNISGYTIISVSEQEKYGAYIIGPKLSTGGFVVNRDGSYKMAETSMSDKNRFWFISGKEVKIATMYLPGAKLDTDETDRPEDATNVNIDSETHIDRNLKITEQADVQILKLMDGSKIKYVGGQFTPVSVSSTSGEDYTFVMPGMKGSDYPKDNELGIIFGMDGTPTEESHGVLTTTNSVELKLPKAANGADSFYFNGITHDVGAHVNCYYLGSSDPSMILNGTEEEKAGIYDLKLQIVGAPTNITAYPGYITLNFQEVLIKNNLEVIVNTIELRVDVYIIAETSVGSDNEYTIKMRTEQKSSNNNSGYSEIIFPASVEFIKGKMYLEEVTTDGINEGAVISVKPTMNHDGTTGWMNVNEDVYIDVGSTTNGLAYNTSDSLHIYVGTMIGTDPTTIRYEIDNFQYGLSDKPSFTLHLVTVKTDGGTVKSKITVELVEAPLIKVKFIDKRIGNTLEVTKTFNYGTVLTPDDCPDTAENFAGWFMDEAKTQPYNFSTPLTDTENTVVLYSAYLIKVTFDNMRGTTYELYLPQSSTGSLIPKELAPHVNTENDGYEEVKWYTEKEYDYEWDFTSDRVNSNITLYAKWVGVEVLLAFYKNESVETPSYIYIDDKKLSIRVDTKIDITIDGKSVLERAREIIFTDDNPNFISWYSKDSNGKTITIGDSTVLKTNMIIFGDPDHDVPNVIKIYATTQNIAIEVDMEKNANDASILISNNTLTIFPNQPQDTDRYEKKYDVYGTFAIKEKNLFTEVTESTKEEGEHIHYVDKYGNEWHKNENTGNYRLTVSGKTEGYYKDVYGNKYTGPEWNSEIEYTSEQILGNVGEFKYTCVYGSEYYYPFTYKLSDATRTGYKLIGWNNESIMGQDISLTPRAGTERTVRLFVMFDNDDRPIVLREVIQLEGSDISTQVETRSWTQQDNVRIDDPAENKQYVIKYLAKWQLLTYNVSVSTTTHGIIDAIVTKNDESGNSQRIRIEGSYDAAYGDRIVLNYTSKDNYKFNGWNAYGEFEIEDSNSINTTLIVKGACTISVREVGDRPVVINILFDDNENREDYIIVNENELEKTYVYLMNTITKTYYELERVVGDTGLPYGKTQQYKGYVPVSDDPYAVVVRYKWSAEETELYYNEDVQGPVKGINVLPTKYKDEYQNEYKRYDLENGAFILVSGEGVNKKAYYPSEDGTNTFYYKNGTTMEKITLIPSQYRDFDDNIYTRNNDNTITGPGSVTYYLQNNVASTYYMDTLQIINDNIYKYNGSNSTASITVTPSKYIGSDNKEYDRMVDSDGRFYLKHGDSVYYPDVTKANVFKNDTSSETITAYPSKFVDSRGVEYTKDLDANGAMFIEDFNGNKYYTGVFEDYTMVGYVDVEMNNELSFTYYIISAYVHDYFASTGERIVDNRAFFIDHKDIENGGTTYEYVSENVYRHGDTTIDVMPCVYTDGTTQYVSGSDEKGVYMTEKVNPVTRYYFVIGDIFSSDDKSIAVIPCEYYNVEAESIHYTVKEGGTPKYKHSNEELVRNSIDYDRYVGALDSIIKAKPDEEKKNKDTSDLPAVKATIKTGYTSKHLLEGFFDDNKFFQISPINEWNEPLVGPINKEFNLNWTAVSKPAEIYVTMTINTFQVTYVVSGDDPVEETKELSFGDDLIYSLEELFGPVYAQGKTAIRYTFSNGTMVRAIDVLDESTVNKIGPGKPITVEVTEKDTLPVLVNYMGQTLDGSYVMENTVRLPLTVSDYDTNVYTGNYSPIHIDGMILQDDVKDGFIVRSSDKAVFNYIGVTDNGDVYKHDDDEPVVVHKTATPNELRDEKNYAYIGFIGESYWTGEVLHMVVTKSGNISMANYSIYVLANKDEVNLQVSEEYQEYIIGTWGGPHKIGETVEMPGMKDKDGHKLENWIPNRTDSKKIDGQIIEKNGKFYYIVGDKDSGTIEFTPVYGQNIFTVTVLTTVDTLVKNGVDLGQRYTESVVGTESFIVPDLKDYIIMAPDIDLVAYSFNGYFVDNDGYKHYPGEPMTLSKNETLIASWTTTRYVLMLGFDENDLSATISSSDLPSDSASKTGVWLELVGYDDNNPHLEGDGYLYYPVDRSDLHAGYMQSPETDPAKRTITAKQYTFKDVEYTIGSYDGKNYIERAGVRYIEISENTYQEEGGTKVVTVTPSKYKDALGNIYNVGILNENEYIERAGIKYDKIGENTYREHGGTKTITVTPYKYDDTTIVTYTIGTDEIGAYMERTTEDHKRFYLTQGIFKNGNREVSITVEDDGYYDSRHVKYTPGINIGQACIFSPDNIAYYPVKVSYVSLDEERIVVNPYEFIAEGADEPEYIWIDLDGPHYLRHVETGYTYYQSANAATHMRSDTGVIKYECKSEFVNPSTQKMTTTYVVGLYYHSQVSLTISPISGNELDIDESKATSLEDSTKVVDIGKPSKQSNGNYIWNFYMTDNMNLDLEPEEESAVITFLVNGQMITKDDISKIELQYKKNGVYVDATGFKFPLYTEIRFKAYDAEENYNWFTSSSMNEQSKLVPEGGWYVLTVREDSSLYTSSDTFTINYYNHLGKIIYTTGPIKPEFNSGGIALVYITDLREEMKAELKSLGLDYYYRFIGWAIELDDGSMDIRYGPVSSYPIVITKSKTASIIDLYPFYLTSGNVQLIYSGDYQNSAVENATTNKELEYAVFNQKAPSMVVYYYTGDKELETLDEFKEYGSIYATSAAFIEIGEHRVQYFVDLGSGNGFRDTYIIKIMERTSTTIVFYDDDEAIETRTYEGDVKLGELPYAEEKGFVGWFLEDGTEITSETRALDLEPTTNAYARWVATVIHFIDQETIVENRTLYGDDVVGDLPDVDKRIGYDFLGWFLADGETEITAETKALDLDRENNVYAKWEKLPETIINFINDDVLVQKRTIYGDDVVGPLPEVSKEGYLLIGWFLEDGKTEITADTRASELESNNTAYAAWEPDPARKITIIHFHNGEETETLTYTGDVTLGPLPDPGTREGYTFIGWFLEDGTDLTPSTRTITLPDENDAYTLWQPNVGPVDPTDPTERTWEKIVNPDGSVTVRITEETDLPDGSVKEKVTETTKYDDKTIITKTESFTDPEGNTTVNVDEKITYYEGYVQRNIEIIGHDGDFVVKVPLLDPTNILDAKEEVDKYEYDTVLFQVQSDLEFIVPEASMPIMAENDYGIEFHNGNYDVILDTLTTKHLNDMGGDVTFTIHRAHAEDLTNEQEAVIGDNFAITVGLIAGEQEVSQLGGTATISVYYNGKYIYYVGDDGKVEEIPCVYNLLTGDITFSVEHFSVYMATKQKIPEPGPGNIDEYSLVIILAIAVLIATIIAVSVIMVRHKN